MHDHDRRLDFVAILPARPGATSEAGRALVGERLFIQRGGVRRETRRDGDLRGNVRGGNVPGRDQPLTEDDQMVAIGEVILKDR